MRASYSAMMDWLATPKAWLKWSNMVGNQGATHDAAGDESRERDPKRRAEAQTGAGATPWWLATRSGPATLR